MLGLSLAMTLGNPTLSAGVGEAARRLAPAVAVPTGGTIYVSGASPSALPAGNDTTGDGTALAPYATLTKAMATVPQAGNMLVLCDGTFAENTAASGSWVFTGLYNAPVVFDSYSGDPANFIVTNTSGSSGVMRVRGNTCRRIQIRRATIRSATESNHLFRSDPSDAAKFGTDIRFYDCVFECKTSGATIPAISLRSDFGIIGLYFVRCEFKRVAGTSTAQEPTLIEVLNLTISTDNQPHQDLGFWDCFMTGDFNRFTILTNGLCGIAKVTFVRNVFRAMLNHAFLLGKDTAGDTNPKVTDPYVYGNTLTATGSNAHGLEIGSNVVAAVVKANVVSTILQGIVCKGSSGALVQGNTVTHVAGVNGGSSLYAKGATGTKFRGNTVNLDGSAFSGYALHEGNDSLVLSGDTEATNNIINATGANADALFWEGASGSTGGAVSNDNTITLAASAELGAVRGATVTDQASLRAVWATDGLAGDAADNDSRSTVAA